MNRKNGCKYYIGAYSYESSIGGNPFWAKAFAEF
jgi:hypothetical protein